MAPPNRVLFAEKVEPVTLTFPPEPLSSPPPKSLLEVLSAFSNVTSSMSRYTSMPFCSTGPLQLEVPHPLALPWLPSRMGLVTPGAGSMVTGAEAEVRGILTPQLPM